MREDTGALNRMGGPGRGSPQHVPPVQEGFTLLYCIFALAGVQFPHLGLQGDAHLFGWFGLNFVLLFVVPALVIRFWWKRPLKEFGLRVGRLDVWGRYFAAFFVLMIPVVLISSRTEAFHVFYPRAEMARTSGGGLVLSMLGWLVYFFAWEFFFRGFMLFALAPRYGGAIAILMQMIPFTMAHFVKVEAEAWSAIFCGIALGVMAFRGRSFVGTWLLHWSVATLMDLCVVWWPLRPG
jgi:uncharacterized protein